MKHHSMLEAGFVLTAECVSRDTCDTIGGGKLLILSSSL